MTDTPTLIWICKDCLMVLADRATESRGDPDHEPLSLLADTDVTLGMLAAEHADDCPNRDGENSVECGCEHREFTWASCEGCGSHSGARSAATIWTPAPERRPSLPESSYADHVTNGLI